MYIVCFSFKETVFCFNIEFISIVVYIVLLTFTLHKLVNHYNAFKLVYFNPFLMYFLENNLIFYQLSINELVEVRYFYYIKVFFCSFFRFLVSLYVPYE